MANNLQVIKPLRKKQPTPTSEVTRDPQTGLVMGTYLGNEDHLNDVYNCAGCGLIYDGECKLPICVFCSRPLTGKTSKEKKRRAEEGEDEAGLQRAMELKNRLLEYDRVERGRTDD